MLKVVLDTNVLIDGSTDDYNYGRRIIDEVIAGNIKAFANHATLAENHLIAKRKISDAGYLARLEYFFDKITPVSNLAKPIQAVEEDSQDNKLLESAVASEADFLITADHHLLKIEKYKGTRILRPAEFWSRYEDGSDQGWTKWLKDFIHA